MHAVPEAERKILNLKIQAVEMSNHDKSQRSRIATMNWIKYSGLINHHTYVSMIIKMRAYELETNISRRKQICVTILRVIAPSIIVKGAGFKPQGPRFDFFYFCILL